MPKVKIARQEYYGFSTTLTIRVSDLNYGGHLGYDKVLTLAHQARLEMFRIWELSELNLGDGNTGLVAGDAAVNYLGEGFLNDLLLVEIQPVELGAIGFRLAHRFSNRETGADIALAEIGFIGFDYQQRKPHRLPVSFTEQLRELAGNPG
ncbi:MAG: thioesterase family protein [Spirochaetaceae bacterium]|nr:thioesterase family protein [Spirochaetaceae bacterium]